MDKHDIFGGILSIVAIMILIVMAGLIIQRNENQTIKNTKACTILLEKHPESKDLLNIFCENYK